MFSILLTITKTTTWFVGLLKLQYKSESCCLEQININGDVTFHIVISNVYTVIVSSIHFARRNEHFCD